MKIVCVKHPFYLCVLKFVKQKLTILIQNVLYLTYISVYIV